MKITTLMAFLATLLLVLGPAHLQASDTNLGKLTDEMEKVKENGYSVLAPETFKKADQQLERAQREDRNNQAHNADEAARQGLKYIEQGNKFAGTAMEVLQEALGVRDKALEAGAQDYSRDQFQSADRQLEDATRAIEQGRIEEAKKRQPELMKLYSELEIEALKKGTVDMAKSKIEQAKQDGAGGEAPKTLKLAESQLTLAQSVLEADRTNTKKADEHANRAVRLAGTALEITRLSKMFKQQNYRNEDILLWYQEQLQAILRSVDNDIRFDQPQDTLVNNLKKAVDSLLESQEASRQEISKKQDRITELENQLNKQLSEANQAQLASEQEKQKFKDVKASFTLEEADVYSQDNDVVIAAHGFYFPVGSAEITTRNFTLLNKIASAIRQYPKATIKISGHTDATGNPATNLKLSVKRAESVSKFLSEVSGLNPAILSSEGLGDTKPIASNQTVEGRSKNRRIEVYIDNPE
jgi:OmpA-OmpF porin, OOP family